MDFFSLLWYNRQEQKTKRTHTMNLYISAADYDYHTLLKGARMVGLASIVGFHESEDGYIVSFPDGENTQALIKDYKAYLQDLKNNIRQH